MVGETLFENAGGGNTRYIARTMHCDWETLEEHEQMEFHEGWGRCVNQLEAVARSLPSIETEPAPSPPAPAPRVSTCLWFEDKALPAAEFDCTLLPESRIERVRYSPEVQGMGEPGSVLVVDFTMRGTPYMALNGGAHFILDEAVSISIPTEDQAETDRLWEALIADGGTESRCGWLKDRFGTSWQVTPKRAVELLNGPMEAKVWPALLQMRKIDIATLEAAAGLDTRSTTTASRQVLGTVPLTGCRGHTEGARIATRTDTSSASVRALNPRSAESRSPETPAARTARLHHIRSQVDHLCPRGLPFVRVKRESVCVAAGRRVWRMRLGRWRTTRPGGTCPSAPLAACVRSRPRSAD